MKFGYIRISTDKQNTALQEDAMSREQCDRIFTDKMTGTRFDRPEFLRMLDMTRPGDIVVVWRLDRLGRSVKHSIETLLLLNEKGVELRSLKENIDTTSPMGKFTYTLIAALAELEHDIIVERTQAGLEAARARGHKGGRPRALTEKQIQQVRTLYADKTNTIREICKTMYISKATLYRYVEVPEK